MKSRVLAISAISAGFVAISLTIGAYFDVADLVSLVLASAFVMLPLYYGSYKGCFLSYAAGGVIALIFSLPRFYSVVFPSFFLFFGLYPIIAEMIREKKLKPAVRIITGIIWCVLYFYGAFFYYTSVLGLSLGEFPQFLSWLEDNLIYFIGVVAVIFYFIFDRFIFVVKRVIDAYLDRIIKNRDK